MINITKDCPICRAQTTKALNTSYYEIKDWREGVLVQDAMPNLTDDEREFVMSGLCDNCMAGVFA